MPTRVDNDRDINVRQFVSSTVGGLSGVERHCGDCANPCSDLSSLSMNAPVQIGMYTRLQLVANRSAVM